MALRLKPLATNCSVVGLRQHVAGDLLDGELAERHVFIQGVDDPVAVLPHRPPQIFFVTVGVGIAGQVKPRRRPALAKVRRGQQAVHHLLISLGTVVGQEGINFLRRGRKANQSQRYAADQHFLAGFGRGLQAFRFQPRENEVINRVSAPAGVFHLGHIGPHGLDVGPMLYRLRGGERRGRVRAARTLINPLANQFHVVSRRVADRRKASAGGQGPGCAAPAGSSHCRPESPRCHSRCPSKLPPVNPAAARFAEGRAHDTGSSARPESGGSPTAKIPESVSLGMKGDGRDLPGGRYCCFSGNRKGVLINPGTNQYDLSCGKRIGAHGHPGLFTVAHQTLHQAALFTIAGNDDLAGFATLQSGSFAVKAQAALRLVAAMASNAVLLKNGCDVARKSDFASGRGRRLRGYPS